MPTASAPQSWAPSDEHARDAWHSSASSWETSGNTWAESSSNQPRNKGKGKGKSKRSGTWQDVKAAAWWGAASSSWWETDASSVVSVPEDPKPFDLSFYLVIVTIFACGAVFGGLVGYLIAYIRFNKLASRDKKKTVAQQTVSPTLDIRVDHSAATKSKFKRNFFEK